MTKEQEQKIRAIIMQAIDDACHQWDAYAIPEVEETSKIALQQIKLVLETPQ